MRGSVEADAQDAAFAAEGAAMIDEIMKGIEPAPEPTPVIGTEVPVEKAKEEPAKEPEAKVEAKPDDENSRGLLRLMEREDQVRKLEADFEAKRKSYEDESTLLSKQVKELETELSGIREKAMDANAIKRKVLTDPVKFFESLGVPPAQVTRLVIAQSLGKDAPADLLREAKDAHFELALEEERAAREQALYELRMERRRPEAIGHLETKTDKGESKYPALSAAAAKDKAKVTNAVWAKVVELTPRGKEPTAEVYAKAAQAVEDEFSFFRNVYGVAAPAVASTTDAAAKTESKAADETKSETKKPRTAPPRRAYWLDPESDDYRDQVMADVIAMAKKK
jgi:hypothetical protein